MTAESPTPPPLDAAESIAESAPGMRCAACTRPIDEHFYQINGAIACAECHGLVRRAMAAGPGLRGAGRALLAGIAAGAVGAALYYAITRLAGDENGAVAIVTALLVGAAVRWGGGGRGGRLCQLMAVALTYASLAGSHALFVVLAVLSGPTESTATDAASLTLIAWSLAMPAYAATQSFIGFLILGIALWLTWRLNQRARMAIAGPFPRRESGPAQPAAP